MADDAEMILGLDLGQSNDPSALAVVKHRPLLDEAGSPVWDSRGREQHRADVVHIHRWPLGTRYPAIVDDVKTLAKHPKLATGGGTPRLALDATGVGRAIVDLFLGGDLPLEIAPITITGGSGHRQEPLYEGGPLGWHVAKLELVGVVQAGLQQETLKVVPTLPLAKVLEKEMFDFKAKITAAANEQFGAWREGQHDDILLALAVALWLGANVPRVVYERPRWGNPRPHLGTGHPVWGYGRRW